MAQSSPAMVASFPVLLAVYLFWRRARYFGNTAPLLVGLLLLFLGLGNPHYPGFGFALAAVPFLFVFVAGVAADLLETVQRSLIVVCIWILLVVNALWNLVGLAHLA